MEIKEQSKKDELKQRREAANQEQALSDWRQVHSRASQCRNGCVHCGKLYLK